MRSRKGGKWLRFVIGMIVYAIIVLILASIGLKMLWDFADNYEKSLPAYKIAEYITSLNENKVKKLSIPFVETLDHNVQSEDDAYAEIWKCFIGGVQYRQSASDNEGNRVSYLILNKDNILGQVTLQKNEGQTGEKTWSVADEAYDFSFLIRSESFIVPEHWVVMCGQKRLGVQYITDPMIPYPFLEDFYGKSFPMPHLAEYTISNYIGDPHIRFFDADGEEQARFTFTDGKDQMLRSTGKVYEDIKDFTEIFVPLYVDCLSNVNHAPLINYQRIQPYIVPDSEIDQRLKAAIAGQVFAQSQGTDLSDIRIHEVFNLENEYYIVDLSYSVDTYSTHGVSTTDTNMQLAVYRDEDVIRSQMVVLY